MAIGAGIGLFRLLAARGGVLGGRVLDLTA